MATTSTYLRLLAGLIVVFLSCMHLAAQGNGTRIPQLLSFQGVLVQPDGSVYPDGRYAISVKLYTSQQGGTPVYQDVISTSIVGGVFNLIIGEQESLEEVDFTQQLWVEVGLPGTSQTAFEPRTKLTTAPYAAVAQQSVVAGGLLPGAKGVVRSLNGAQGDVNIIAAGGLIITQDGSDVTIDATAIKGIVTITTQDSVLRIQNPDGPAVAIGVRDSSITSRHLRGTGVAPGTYGDSVNVPRITVGKDGRVSSITTVPVGNVQTSTLQIASGRYVNVTANRLYTVTINTTTAAPVALPVLLPNARILITIDSPDGTTAYAISQRTVNGFTVSFAGGLAPNTSFSWMVINL
ncbi:MAG: hypothetical protein FGM32_00230 [Candidatus Kapabacteria bacterium]|nr:hypothetical protein [Candidatus Kapabacteria bacterium]